MSIRTIGNGLQSRATNLFRIFTNSLGIYEHKWKAFHCDSDVHGYRLQTATKYLSMPLLLSRRFSMSQRVPMNRNRWTRRLHDQQHFWFCPSPILKNPYKPYAQLLQVLVALLKMWQFVIPVLHSRVRLESAAIFGTGS